MALPSDSVLPAGSLILVTGINGLVGSHVVEQLLTYGFKVRGTVRNAEKYSWMSEHFVSKHGAGKFELVQVAELDKLGCLDEAIKGCDGVVHTASPVTMSPDPNEVVTPAINTLVAALEAAAATSSVKRFVFTSSSITTSAEPGTHETMITPEIWTDHFIDIAWAPPPYTQDRIFPVYGASKVQAEHKLWDFMRERKPHFVANAVLPNMVLGAPINVEKLGFTSSLMLHQWFVNNQDGWQMIPPGYMIDAADTGRLHVAALVKPDARSERVFGFAHPKSWADVARVVRKYYPEQTVPDVPEDAGTDESTITARLRSEAMLRWLGQPGFRAMDESLKELVNAIMASQA